ncbi:MAG: hypothetical protein ABI873_13285, partial [Marmoricola sp.]
LHVVSQRDAQHLLEAQRECQRLHEFRSDALEGQIESSAHRREVDAHAVHFVQVDVVALARPKLIEVGTGSAKPLKVAGGSLAAAVRV